VNPRRCALPLATRSARILTLGPSRNLKLNLKGLSDGEAVTEFTVEADASLAANLGSEDPSEYSVLSTDETGSVVLIEKPLIIRGLLTLGQFERPLGGEIASIASLPDDPGRQQWLAADLLRRLPRLDLSSIPPETFDAIRKATQFPPGTFDAIRRAQFPPGTFDFLRRPQETPENPPPESRREDQQGPAQADDAVSDPEERGAAGMEGEDQERSSAAESAEGDDDRPEEQ
jgi:hypothetical protein